MVPPEIMEKFMAPDADGRSLDALQLSQPSQSNENRPPPVEVGKTNYRPPEKPDLFADPAYVDALRLRAGQAIFASTPGMPDFNPGSSTGAVAGYFSAYNARFPDRKFTTDEIAFLQREFAKKPQAAYESWLSAALSQG